VLCEEIFAMHPATMHPATMHPAHFAHGFHGGYGHQHPWFSGTVQGGAYRHVMTPLITKEAIDRGYQAAAAINTLTADSASHRGSAAFFNQVAHSERVAKDALNCSNRSLNFELGALQNEAVVQDNAIQNMHHHNIAKDAHDQHRAAMLAQHQYMYDRAYLDSAEHHNQQLSALSVNTNARNHALTQEIHRQRYNDAELAAYAHVQQQALHGLQNERCGLGDLHHRRAISPPPVAASYYADKGMHPWAYGGYGYPHAL